MTTKQEQTQLKDLVARLEKAHAMYHTTSELLMTDAEYDAGLEELRRRSPSHPLLTKIGESEGKGGAALLPYRMASLNKIHPDSQGGGGAVERWKKKMVTAGATTIVCMEKLDGLSALFCVEAGVPPRLYLRGDGVKGVDVSACIRGIPCLTRLCVPGTRMIVRGELLLSEANTPAGSIGRSLVNGWVHRGASAAGGAVPEELRKVDFVGYQVLEPKGLSRDQQLTWMVSRGLAIPNAVTVKVAEFSDRGLEQLLTSWKTGGGARYPFDGIVCGPGNLVPVADEGGVDLKNPTDMVAFKMVTEEQVRTTEVVAVHWSASAQGVLIPRIQVRPVEIGGAQIEFCSGHNARTIASLGIGPGARIQLRRSGDVIPTVDKVLSAVPPSFPAEGTWVWSSAGGAAGAGAEEATHIRVKEGDTAGEAEIVRKQLTHTLEILGAEGVGPGIVAKLVEAGLQTPLTLFGATETRLCQLLGPGRGANVYAAIRARQTAWTELDFLCASNLLPRGVGERKLRPLFALEADPRMWVSRIGGRCEAPTGWTAPSIKALCSALPAAIAWRESQFPSIPYRLPALPESSASTTPVKKGVSGTVVFTGGRNRSLEEAMVAAGWTIADAITKQATLLIIPSSPHTQTTKEAKAASLGISIRTMEDCLREFLA
jgi:DNA ligase (NAD+)